MYCIIRYSALDNSDVCKDSTNSRTSVPPKSNSLIDETKELLVNPNCYIQILIDYICEQTGIDVNDKFDLCNEAGQIKKIKSYPQDMYATEILNYEEVYYIVFYECTDSGKYIKLELLLNKTHKGYSDIALKLKRSLSIIKRHSSTRSSKRRSTASTKSLGSQATLSFIKKDHN